LYPINVATNSQSASTIFDKEILTMAQDTLLYIWGKTNRPKQNRYHPLLFHMLDVAHCARVLWQRGLSPRVRARIIDALGVTEEVAEDIVVLVTALHDLGKAYPNFQVKSDAFATELIRLGLSLKTNGNDIPHGTASIPEIERLLKSSDFALYSCPAIVAIRLATISGGHHGVFPPSSEVNNADVLRLGRAEWQAQRDALAKAAASVLLKERRHSLAQCPEDQSASWVPLLAGLISVADWFGSSKDFVIDTPAGQPKPLPTYLPLSVRRAEETVSKSGWMERVTATEDKGFSELFPFSANAVQQAAIEQIGERNQPYLLIVESAMGSGKTEVALYCTDRARYKGYANGFYIALPTMATSNAMYNRVAEFLQQRHPGQVTNLPLVHSHALLDDAYLNTIVDGPIYDDDIGEDGKVVAQRWFAENKKQALLAQFGVGTIDQALLSVLQTRHWFVRLFGLAGKVVCFDEIHAYDIYTSELLLGLLRWLKQLDCTVILLSATLPAKMRQALVEAYAPGAFKGVVEAKYPRLTLASPKEKMITSIPVTSEEDSKTVAIDVTANSSVALLKELRQALPTGGCAAVVCNTVQHAQELYCELAAVLESEGWECHLFHARTPFAWRKDTEDLILAKFGKKAGTPDYPARPEKAIVVATAVLEQSLDLDFDWMASEMAPIDLVLQRMGRLHRHDLTKYARPHRPAQARFCLLVDQDGDNIPDFGASVQLAPEKSIYDRYIVLRSWLVVKNCPILTLPIDIEKYITAVYDADVAEDLDLTNNWKEALQDSQTRAEAKKLNDRNAARNVLIRDPKSFLDKWLDGKQERLYDADDPTTHETVRAATRLGDPSITVVCFGTLADSQEKLPPLTDGTPTNDVARNWMKFSVSLQNKRVFNTLCKKPTPPGWDKSPLLKYCRALEFMNGETKVGDVTIRLSKKHGLEII
jgi:CRISPR-associated endonuclease/helicase Cas3